MDIVKLIQEDLSTIIKEAYDYSVAPEDINIEHPDNSEWGDYASNIPLQIAKLVKQSPLEIAKTVSYKMCDKYTAGEQNHLTPLVFEKVYSAPPGFINIKLHKSWLLEVFKTVLSEREYYGTCAVGESKRIALEHSNVNPNKAAHVGHLRNATIGQFVERVYEALGYDVEVQYYANDVGLQVATSSLGIETIKDIDPSSYTKFDHYAWDVYSEISTILETNKDLKDKLDSILVSIENPNSEESKKQAQLADKILQNQLETFSQLGIDYDVIVHERDILYLDFWKTAFGALKTNPNVYKATEGNSKGCWLIKLSGSGKSNKDDVEEDKIIVRSNGVPTYTGKDIAYHMWKFGLLGKDFNYKKYSTDTQKKTLWETSYLETKDNDVSFTNADYVYNVIDVKQTYPIDVVKQSLKFLGFESSADNMFHINYGFVYLSPSTAKNMGIDTSDNKDRYGMSGRKGWGIKIDDLIEMVDKSLVNEHGTTANLAAVRNAAIKFEMLRYNTFQDVVFDIDEALNIKGFTGPYLQYTHARTCSLIDKASVGEVDTTFLDEQNLNDITSHELAILRTIYKYPEVIKRSAEEFAPNILCNYLFDLCQKYNYFYNEVPVLSKTTDAEMKFRLALTKVVGQVIKNGLHVLGIEAPTRM